MATENHHAIQFQELKISSKFGIKAKGVAQSDVRRGTDGAQGSGSFAYAMSGTFKRSSKGRYSLSGTLSVQGEITYADGQSHCDSGLIGWKLKLQ